MTETPAVPSTPPRSLKPSPTRVGSRLLDWHGHTWRWSWTQDNWEYVGAVPDAGQARADRLAAGIRRFADDCKLLLDFGGLDNRVARSIAQQERNLRALLAEPSGATVQTPHVADLAYARSEVDKWLASTDPYCILPTRTEHIPALLARLDELEGTR